MWGASWARWCQESGEDPERLPPLSRAFCQWRQSPVGAQRLGLEAHARDRNPVAVMMCKAMIEIPRRFAGRPPVNPAPHLLEAPASRPPTPHSLGTQAPHLGTRASRPPSPKGWHSRGYLPHFDQPGLI